MNLSRRLAATAALVVTTLSLAAAPAAAHTGFETSDPSDGSVVAGQLAEIVLTFSGEATPAGEGFVILEPTGATRTPDTLTAGPEQKVWTLGFDPPLAGGPVGLRWTVQARDAHPIEGRLRFTIDAPAPVGEAEEKLDESTPTEDAPVEPAPAGGQDLQAFLAETETEVPNAAGVGTVGRFLGFVGTMLGIGGLAFVIWVLHGHRRDVIAVLQLVRYSAVLVFVGTVVDFVAHVAVAGEGWLAIGNQGALESAALSSYGIAVGLRSASALLLLASTAKAVTFTNRAPLPRQSRSMATVGAGAATRSDTEFMRRPDIGWLGPPPELGPLTYSTSQDREPADVSISVSMILSIVALLVSFTFDGHTVSEGNRWITGAVDMVHVVAGAVWAGGVLSFAIVLWRRHRRNVRLGALELAVRFSVIAGSALAAAGVAGTILAIIILDSLSELRTTPWGLLLIAKFTAVAAAAGLGAFNHFVVIPALETAPADDGRSLMLRNTATGEAILLCVVLVMTAFLVGAAST